MPEDTSDKCAFLFRLSYEVKAALREAAWRARVPMGDFAEKAIREKLEREALTPAGE